MGTGSPSEGRHWELCSTKLHNSIVNVLSGAIAACDTLNDETDGDRLVEELKKRVEDHWEAYRFDSYIAEAAARLGFSGLGTVAFRSKHLEGLRRVVAISDGDARERLLTQHIEAKMIDLMADALPITAKELIDCLCLSQPEQIATALILLRETTKKAAA